MTLKIGYIESRSVFELMNEKEKTEAYFRLVDQIRALTNKTDKPQKNSENSSQSPHTDLTRSHKKGGDESGVLGPPKGHKGVSRAIKTNPDHIITVPIRIDPATGEKVESSSQSFQIHQVLEIEPLKAVVIEIRRQTTTVNGKTVTAPNPDGIGNHCRIGPNLKSHVAYMRFTLNVPWKKILVWLRETAGDTVGVGTLRSIFNELKALTKDDLFAIQQRIQKAKVVGVDETGIYVNGSRWWMHVMRTDTETLFTADPSRGHSVAAGILGNDFDGTLLSDFFGAYNAKFYGIKTKFAKCMAHLLRMTKYSIECEPEGESFAQAIMNICIDAVYLKKFFVFNTDVYKTECGQIQDRFEKILRIDRASLRSDESRKLLKLLRRYPDEILRFLYLEDLPADNNGSERDIRDFVVARKISSAWRTPEGIKLLAQVKSVVSTARKASENVFSLFQKKFGVFRFSTA